MDNQLIALYKIKRQTFLNGFIQTPQNFKAALAYAYYPRIAPVFHEEIACEKYGVDPFEVIYDVKSDFILEVLEFVDERDLAKDYTPIEFYNLEAKFGGYKSNRMALIRALEYARISGRFDGTVWDAIERNAPSEANSLDADFTSKDAHFG